jgi:hypothetical protein
MDRHRGILAGIFFITAAIPAIAALGLYDPVLHDTRYVAEAARSDAPVLLGAFLELIVAISVVGTATTLFPLLRRHSESFAISYVAGRLVEAIMILTGVLSLLAVVTLRQDAVGAGALAAGRALVAVHDWTFLLGPGLAIGINTTLLASVVYRARLAPRGVAALGLAGGPAVFASSVAILFGAYDQVSAIAALAAFPVFAWEMSLAGWLIAKGAGAAAPAPAQ